MNSPTQDWRRWALTVVVLGAMAVSISGQVQAIEPQIGHIPAIVFALTNDAGSILALNVALSASPGSPVRKWAWVAILVAAGAGASLNSWHVINGTSAAPLPWPLAVMAGGVEPILLVLVLSHLIGLVVGEHHETTSDSDHQPDTTIDRQDPAVGDRQDPTNSGQQPARGDRQETYVVVGGDTTSGTAGDHQEVTITATPDTTSPPAPPAQRALPAAARRPATPPRRALASVPSPRPSWMTDTLLSAVIHDMRQAQAAGESYGRPRLMSERKLTDYRSGALLAYIRDRRLLEQAS